MVLAPQVPMAAGRIPTWIGRCTCWGPPWAAVWNIIMHRPDSPRRYRCRAGRIHPKPPSWPIFRYGAGGNADTTIPVSASHEITAAMRTSAIGLGYSDAHIYTEEPGAGHGWGAAQAFTPEVDAWWLAAVGILLLILTIIRTSPAPPFTPKTATLSQRSR